MTQGLAGGGQEEHEVAGEREAAADARDAAADARDAQADAREAAANWREQHMDEREAFALRRAQASSDPLARLDRRQFIEGLLDRSAEAIARSRARLVREAGAEVRADRAETEQAIIDREVQETRRAMDREGLRWTADDPPAG